MTAVSSFSSDRPLRVVCAVPHALDTSPSQRYRWEQWAPGLSQEGVRLDFLPFGSLQIDADMRAGRTARASALSLARYAPWLVELRRAREADVLVIPRKAAPAGPPAIEEWAARGRAKFVYDFDDAIFMEPEGARGRIRAFLDPASRCERLCRAADLVVAGNHYLAEWARPRSRNVIVIPTTVNTDQHVPRLTPKPDSARPVLGWSGSRSTAKYLEELLPLLRNLQSRVDFELLVVGASIDLRGVEGRVLPWTSATEVPLLQEMDIGLMPLQSTEWEKGKCSLKALLYGAIGIPSVVSNVGTNPEAVIDGKTGLVVDSEKDWSVALERLVTDLALRRSLGAAARAHVIDNYSSRRWAPELARQLKAIARSSRAP